MAKTPKKTSSIRKIEDYITKVEELLPPQCAEPWDSVGFVVDFRKSTLKGVTVGVDLTAALLDEAELLGYNLVVIHHPPLFPKGRGITRLAEPARKQDLDGLLLRAYEAKISVYVAHTNFDRCALDGMFQLANDLGSSPVGRVWETPEPGQTLLKKLVTYVPQEHFEKVRDALYEIGCGHIGNYDSCGFATPGLGNFRPMKSANPYIGNIGEHQTVEEVRLETLVVSGMEAVAIDALKSAHPYEEVAYDFYPVEQLPPKQGFVWGLGYGFVAELKKPMEFSKFVGKVKRVFQCNTVLTSQYEPKMVQRIAFTPGKGTSFLKSVQAAGVDVFITGEVGYHGSLDSARKGLAVFELGHRESEHYFLKTFAAWSHEWDVKVSSLDERTQRFL
jgi:dinuclear metal center YbgI/SA1388 family protein